MSKRQKPDPKDDQKREIAKWILEQLKNKGIADKALKRMKQAGFVDPKVFDVSEIEVSQVTKVIDAKLKASASDPPAPKKPGPKRGKAKGIAYVRHPHDADAHDAKEARERLWPRKTFGTPREEPGEPPAHDYEPDGFWISRIRFANRNRKNTPESLFAVTHDIYEHLANMANAEVYRRRYSAPEATEKEARTSGVFLDSNQLYQIHYMSEDLVRNAYDPDGYPLYHSPYENYLRYSLGASGVSRMYQLAKKLLRAMPPADKTVLRFFGYTDNGLTQVWWDPEGTIREAETFTEEETARISKLSPRTTVLWKNPTFLPSLLESYLHALVPIEEALKEDEIPWKRPSVKEYFKTLLQKRRALYNPRGYSLAEDIAKIVENGIREQIPGMNPLNDSRQRESLYAAVPAPILEAVFENASSYRIPKVTWEGMRDILLKNRTRIKVAEAWIKDAKREDILSLLDGLDAELRQKLAARHIKSEKDPQMARLYYALIRVENRALSKTQKTALEKVIDPTQQKAFVEISKLLASGDLTPSTALPELDALAEPLRKTIELDPEAIRASRRALDQTIRLVESFVGEESGSEDAAEAAEMESTEVENAVRSAVNSMVDSAVRSTVDSAVNSAVDSTADSAANSAVDSTVRSAETEKQMEEADVSTGDDLFDAAERVLLRRVLDASRDGDGLSKSAAQDVAQEQKKFLHAFVAGINEKAFDLIGAAVILEEGNVYLIDSYDFGDVESWLGMDER